MFRKNCSSSSVRFTIVILQRLEFKFLRFTFKNNYNLKLVWGLIFFALVIPFINCFVFAFVVFFLALWAYLFTNFAKNVVSRKNVKKQNSSKV